MTATPAVWLALLAASLFGASTPFAKLLVGEMAPMLLGGLLYLGSGVGLTLARLVRDRGWRASGLAPREWPWLLGAILFGGMFGPVALMVGLTYTSGATASLLLNLESVLTALLAWIAFKENADRRIVLGMVAIVAGGILLSWPSGEAGASHWLGPLAIALACLCWAIDNNLTRHVSAADALFIAGTKGLMAGGVNCALALGLGHAPTRTPDPAGDDVGRLARLRDQLGAVRLGAAGAGDSAHRGLLCDSPFYRCRRGTGPVG
jgi:drug/metabolite transporter (DMT)-like permease